MNTRATCFATCAKGLEPYLHAELKALQMGKIERQVGGVRFEAKREDIWRANLWLRTANRVLLRLDHFQVRDEEELYRAVSAQDWGRWLAPSGSLVVAARVRDSVLTHSRYVEQRVKDAIVDQMRARHGTRPNVEREEPDLYVHLHLWRDKAVLSLDSSGKALYLRGWRRHQGRAPLAETLAAGLVLASGWNQRAPLLDPFLGSGTILIEAALLASRRAPGLLRARFGFEGWLDHDPLAFERLRQDTRALAQRPSKLRLYGWDLQAERVSEAAANAEAAGVGEWLVFEQGDARELELRSGWNAWIASNLPYGERVGEARELGQTYGAFAKRLAERCRGYGVGILSGNPESDRVLAALGLAAIALENAALPCQLWTGTIP